jgi:hypothetical protein
MFPIDADHFVEFRRQTLIEEAQHERLLAELPHAASGMRRGLASACYRIATWLDADWYARRLDASRDDWVRESATA